MTQTNINPYQKAREFYMNRKNHMDLYTIDSEYYSILQKEELTHEDMIKIDNITQNERHKIIVIAGYVGNIKAELRAVEDAILHSKARAQRLSNKIDFLQYKIREKMDAIGTDHIKDSPHFEIKLHSNPPSVDIFDESVLPEQYYKRKETYVIDRESLLNDLKSGGESPGARLKQDKRLVIK